MDLNQQPTIDYLREEAKRFYGHLLSKSLLDHFEHPNHRMTVGVIGLNNGYKELAYQLFLSIVEEGPKEDPNQHFAYVRSLIEIAGIQAEKELFEKAEASIQQALHHYPSSMEYMASLVHLEVDRCYYQFQQEKKEEAEEGIIRICDREKERFHALPKDKALYTVGPGLCYAIHQHALFYAMQDDWEKGVLICKELSTYTPSTDFDQITQAVKCEENSDFKQAFYHYEQAFKYPSL